jgi:effector-binding domain-containing protein
LQKTLKQKTKMKTLKIVTVILAVILGVFLIPPLFMAKETKVTKTKVLKASPEIIWEQVNCLKNWESWDEWHQDTNLVGRYEGPECGVGAKNIWTYKNTSDGGTQTIVESRENEYLRTELEFAGMGTAVAEFFMEKAEEGTKVTWNLTAPAPYPIFRWISTVMIKPEVGKSYEKGLEKLDEITMNMKPKPKYKTGEVRITEVTGQKSVGLKVESGMVNMSYTMGESYGKLMDYIEKTKNQLAGTPFAIWYQWEDTAKFVYECAVPVVNKVKGEGDIRFFDSYTGKAVTTEHWGDYATSGNSWTAVMKYVEENKLESNGEPFEVYITDPTTEPDPQKWLTMLYFPVK